MLETLKTIYNPKRNWKQQTAMVSKDRKEHIWYAYGESLKCVLRFCIYIHFSVSSYMDVSYEILKEWAINR